MTATLKAEVVGKLDVGLNEENTEDGRSTLPNIVDALVVVFDAEANMFGGFGFAIVLIIGVAAVTSCFGVVVVGGTSGFLNANGAIAGLKNQTIE